MGDVVLAKENLFRRNGQVAQNMTFDPEFVTEPGHHGFAEKTERTRERGERRSQQPLEFEKRFFVIDDIFHILDRDTALRQTELNSLYGKTGIMFFARKPLFLGCRHDHTIPQESRGRVVVVTRYTQDIHLSCHIFLRKSATYEIGLRGTQ